jgi:hypothetical protein
MVSVSELLPSGCASLFERREVCLPPLPRLGLCEPE